MAYYLLKLRDRGNKMAYHPPDPEGVITVTPKSRLNLGAVVDLDNKVDEALKNDKLGVLIDLTKLKGIAGYELSFLINSMKYAIDNGKKVGIYGFENTQFPTVDEIKRIIPIDNNPYVRFCKSRDDGLRFILSSYR